MSFLDRVASALKGGGERRVPLARSFISPWALAYDRSGGAPPFDYDAAIRAGFIANPIAQRAVRIVAEGVGRAPLSVNEDRVASLINATSAGQPLIETLAAQLLLHGNGYVQLIKDGSGTPVELFALRPERMSVIAGPDGWPCGYEYRVGTGKLTIALEDENGWPEIIHIKALHPADDHYGAGALVAANQAIAIHNAASQWNRSLLENAARPSGALVYDAPDGASLTAEQFERLKAELATAYGGNGNAGRPMLLDGGLNGRAWRLPRRTWISPSSRARPHAISPWPSAYRRCCSACPATIPMPIIAKPIVRCGGSPCYHSPINCFPLCKKGWRPGSPTQSFRSISIRSQRFPKIANVCGSRCPKRNS